jgi:hypothetical protein
MFVQPVPIIRIPFAMVLGGGVGGGLHFGFVLVWSQYYEHTVLPMNAVMYPGRFVYQKSVRHPQPHGPMSPINNLAGLPFNILEMGAQIQEYRRAR